MIDWLSLRIPCQIEREIFGDTLACIDRDGVVKYEKKTFLSVEGSFSTNIVIKSSRFDEAGKTSELYISGNPSKFLQGHNIFGSDDLRGVVRHFVSAILTQLKIPVDPHIEFALDNGMYVLTRVDCTDSVRLPSLSDVRAFLRSLKTVATSKRQNISDRGDTLYFGQNSRRSTIKFYAKGPELIKHPLPVQFDSESLEMLTSFAQPLLRVEVTLRSMELKRRNLDRGFNWFYNSEKWQSADIHENTVRAIVSERMTSLNLPEHIKLDEKTLEGLPARLQLAYNSWCEGKDLRSILPRRTFTRYRSQLLKHGIDLNCPPVQPEKSNVVPLIRYLVAEPVSVPSWAVGTPLFFDPSNTPKKAS